MAAHKQRAAQPWRAQICTVAIFSLLTLCLAGCAVSNQASQQASNQAASMSLSPGSLTLQTGHSQQFTATVTGSSNPAVAWSASGGGISSSGLYTAPSAAGSFTITATSVADTTKAASASVTVGAPAAQHTVTLTWTASTSSVVGYNVYRGTVSGGPYTKVNSVLEAASNYVDNTVQSGAQYFYVVTAEDASAAESVFSSQVSVAVPTP
jgi:hypothetical protein